MMNETLIYFTIVRLAFNTLIPTSFPFAEAPLKLHFLESVNLHPRNFLISSMSKMFKLEPNFHFEEKGKYHMKQSLMSMKDAALAQSSVLQETSIQKVTRQLIKKF